MIHRWVKGLLRLPSCLSISFQKTAEKIKIKQWYNELELFTGIFNVGEKIDLPFIINFCSKIYFTFKYIYTATYFCNEELSVNTL